MNMNGDGSEEFKLEESEKNVKDAIESTSQDESHMDQNKDINNESMCNICHCSTNSVCISDVPEELHMYILSQLDGQSLINAKRTCKMWACLIENLEKYFHIWLMCCLKEIPLYMLNEILGYWQEKVNTKELVKEYRQFPWMFWREIYAEYSRAYMVGWRRLKEMELYYNQEHSMVTALAFDDGKLISGHEDGSVFIWRRVSSQAVDLQLLHKHARRVTCMAVTSTCKSASQLLSGSGHTLVVTGSQDYHVLLSDLKMKKSLMVERYNKQVNAISCLGPYITAVASGTFLQGQTVWKIRAEEDLSATVQSQFESSDNYSNPVHVALTEEKVYVAEENGVLYRWKWKDGVPNKSVVIINLTSPIKAMLYKDSCAICLLENGKLELTDDGGVCKTINVHETVGKQPESMAWRGALFALGFKGGTVLLYVIKDLDSLKTIDLSTPAAKLQVDADHVNHIAIGDDGISPLVAVGTEKMYISLFRFVK